MSGLDPNGRNAILATVGGYYTDKVVTHGATPRGVDWRDRGRQPHRRGAQVMSVSGATV